MCEVARARGGLRQAAGGRPAEVRGPSPLSVRHTLGVGLADVVQLVSGLAADLTLHRYPYTYIATLFRRDAAASIYKH